MTGLLRGTPERQGYMEEGEERQSGRISSKIGRQDLYSRPRHGLNIRCGVEICEISSRMFWQVSDGQGTKCGGCNHITANEDADAKVRQTRIKREANRSRRVAEDGCVVYTASVM